MQMLVSACAYMRLFVGACTNIFECMWVDTDVCEWCEYIQMFVSDYTDVLDCVWVYADATSLRVRVNTPATG